MIYFICYLLSQKAAEIADVESRHRRELEAVQKQLMEAKKQAESRETELRKEIDSLKRIIADLQDKLGMFWELITQAIECVVVIFAEFMNSGIFQAYM